jgi:multisubunit Na+/H+ antiporter MnhF subunit
MRNYIIPAIGIVVVTLILVTINEFTEMSFIKDYALILIIAAMLLGVGLAKFSDQRKGK